jgi:flagellar biosynthesis/type III secretory pathway M-ring protein FliF/YscJ
MRQFLADLQKNVKGIWSRLDAGQRLVVVAVLLASMVGLGAMLWYAAQPSWVTVFTATNGDDLREAKRLLQSANVAFVPDDSGFSLRVDERRIAAANSALAEGNLAGAAAPHGSQSSPFADRETREKELKDKAVQQAEVVIAALAGVRSAKLLANYPRRSPFTSRDKETQATAAVSLHLKPGVAFEAVARGAAQLAASQMMVPLENVTVINAVTYQRWRFDPDREAGGGTAEFLAQQRSLADERTRLAQNALDALWPGKTIVTVGVELDPRWEITNQKVMPPDPVLVSEQTTKDSMQSGEAVSSRGGDPSTQPTPAAAPGARSETKKETTKREYLPDVGERRSGKVAPEIRRLTVALLYDKALEKKTGFSKDDLVKVVKSIVGWDQTRDDKDGFSTLADEFPTAAPEAEAVAMAGPGLLDRALQWAPMAGQVLGLALVLLFLKGLLKQPRARVRAGAGAGAGSAGGGGIDADEGEQPPEEQQKRMRREIERAIAADPAALAKMLERWLAETQV